MTKAISELDINARVPWRKLLSNFSGLSLAQGVNALLPIIVIPYLFETLGVEKLGDVFLAQALANFFVQIVDYGFPNTAVRQIAQSRSSFHRNTLTGQLLTLRLCLLFSAFVFYMSIIVIFPAQRFQHANFLLSYLLVAGQAVSPYWFFQGIDKIKYHVLLNLIAKVAFILLVFVAVKEKDDYYLVNGLQGGTALLVGLIGWSIVSYRRQISFNGISIYNLIANLKSGLTNFISNFIVFCSTNSYLILTGYFAGAVQSGYYGLAEKVFLLTRALPITIHQSIYSYVCRTADNSFNDLRKFFDIFYLLVLAIFIPITLLIFFFSSQIIEFLTGTTLPQAATLLKIVSPISLLAAMSIPPSQILLAKHFNRSYLVATLIGCAISLTCTVVLISQWQDTGAAVAALLGEMTILISLAVQIERNHRNFSLFIRPI